MLRRAAAVCVAFLTFLSIAEAQKKRVAVMNFDYGAVTASVTQLFGTNQDIGKGIADMLVDRLVSDGKYSVIERKELDKIIAEQNFSNSDRADPSSAAKIARILGVNAIIIGSITQFGRDDKKTSIGGGALGGISGRFGVGGVSKSNSMAVVQLTGRMIDTSTAEILASASAKGEASRSGTGILGSGGSWGGEGGAGLDMRSSRFRRDHPRRGHEQSRRRHGEAARFQSGEFALHRGDPGERSGCRCGAGTAPSLSTSDRRAASRSAIRWQ